MAETKVKCECGNKTEDNETYCPWCIFADSEPAHVGHFSRLGGTWWCDTCDSPYCDLA